MNKEKWDVYNRDFAKTKKEVCLERNLDCKFLKNTTNLKKENTENCQTYNSRWL